MAQRAGSNSKREQNRTVKERIGDWGRIWWIDRLDMCFGSYEGLGIILLDQTWHREQDGTRAESNSKRANWSTRPHLVDRSIGHVHRLIRRTRNSFTESNLAQRAGWNSKRVIHCSVWGTLSKPPLAHVLQEWEQNRTVRGRDGVRGHIWWIGRLDMCSGSYEGLGIVLLNQTWPREQDGTVKGEQNRTVKERIGVRGRIWWIGRLDMCIGLSEEPGTVQRNQTWSREQDGTVKGSFREQNRTVKERIGVRGRIWWIGRLDMCIGLSEEPGTVQRNQTWSREQDGTVKGERDQIVGSYLVIEEIVSEDYGEYMCQVSNGVDDDEIKIHAHLLRQDSHSILGFHKGSWHKSLLLSILVLALFCSVAAVYVRCWLPLTLFWRDKFIAPEENDGKEWDALICYRERDSVYVIESIIPTLETKYHYKCTPLKLSDSSQSWHSDIGPLASRARRLLLVLDSDSARSSTGALGQLCQLGRPPVLLLVGDLHPHPNRPRQQQLFSKSFQSTCELIECLGPGEDRCDFWHRLRLALPPTPRRRRSSRQDAVVNEQQLRPRDALELIV
ncbi:hypothetical protein QAD02_020241 [Eretmocerus hayati]|uniref:Uncharacterized protein n=1 Tax=Eretmocerus hayati TaxID=131215 RepID=A0ACC2PMC6_9HYME|nr:hypothetical protein QAD02_020241 [Eretmocerus hayati]